MIYRMILLAVIATASVAEVFSQNPHGSPLNTLVKTEQAFAAMSVKEGMKKAFLSYLADDAVIFRPGPVNGKERWDGAKENEAQLDWHPTLAFLAASGELGYTSGPWTYTPGPNLDQPPQYGYFISVWKKQIDGQWKVALDIGVTTGHSPTDTVLVVPESFYDSSSKPQSMKTEKNRVLDAEKKFSAFAQSSGVHVAFDKFLSDDARVYREGTLPLKGRDEVGAHFREGSMRMNSNASSCQVSDSRDLAYTYGTCSSAEATASGYFFRIWRKNAAHSWKLALDVISPGPPPK